MTRINKILYIMKLKYGMEVLINGEICTIVDVIEKTGEISVLDYNMNKSWKVISQIEKIINKKVA